MALLKSGFPIFLSKVIFGFRNYPSLEVQIWCWFFMVILRPIALEKKWWNFKKVLFSQALKSLGDNSSFHISFMRVFFILFVNFPFPFYSISTFFQFHQQSTHIKLQGLRWKSARRKWTSWNFYFIQRYGSKPRKTNKLKSSQNLKSVEILKTRNKKEWQG